VRAAGRAAVYFGTYSAKRAAQDRSQPLSAGHEAAASIGERTVAIQVRPQVSGQMRTSGHVSATMLGVRAGVAQLAEQPSCKRQVTSSILVTGSLALKASQAPACGNAGMRGKGMSHGAVTLTRITAELHSGPVAGRVRAGKPP
jgi:hypothetical protein